MKVLNKPVLKASDVISSKEKVWAAAIGLLLLVCVGVFATFLPGLKTTYSVSQFLPENHPLITSDFDVRKRFFIDEVQPILVVVSQEKSWLETDRLQQLEEFSTELQKIDHVKDIVSLAQVQVNLEPVPSTPVTAVSRGSEEPTEIKFGLLGQLPDMKSRQQATVENPVLSPGLISKDQRSALIVVRTQNDVNNEQVLKMIQDIRAAAKVWPVATAENARADVKVEIGGVPAIQSQLAQMVSHEVIRFLAFALVASCLALMVVFRTWSSFLVPLVIIVVTNVFVLSLMAILNLSMSVLAVTVPILVAVNVLSLASHTMLRVSEEWLVRENWLPKQSSHSQKWQTIIRSFRLLTLPNLMTAMTTAVGFLTLLTTKVPVIREYGLSVAIAVFASWVITTLLLGPLLLFVPIPEGRDWATKGAGWTSRVFQLRWLLVPVTLTFALIMTHFGQDLKWSAKLFDDLPENHEARRATEHIDKRLGGSIPFEIVLEKNSTQVSVWSQPRRLAKLDLYLKSVRKLDGVGNALGLPDLLRQTTGQNNLPISAASVNEQYFLMQMAEESPLKTLLTNDGRATRISFRLQDLSSDKAQRLMDKLQKMAVIEFPDMKVSVGGMGSTVHVLNDELSKELMAGFWQALGAIALLILIVFRSLRWTLVAVLPNLLPAATLLGILALMETPVKPGVAIVFSIALGIAFDNTIYLLGRLKLLRDSNEAIVPRPKQEDLIRQMLSLEANPCLISTLCLTSGFAIFLASQFQINATFGAYVIVSLIFGFIGDVFFMPSFVSLAPSLFLGRERLRPILNEQGADIMQSLNGSRPKLKLVKSPSQLENSGLDPEQVEDQDADDGSLSKSVAAGLALFLILGASDVCVAANPAQQPRKPASTKTQTTSATKSAATKPVPAGSANNLTVDAILKGIEAKVQASDEDATLKMIVTESNGTSKTREMEIKRKTSEGEKVLVRMRAPADVKGIALLSVFQNGNEDQWLYLPSSKKTRRVVSSNRTSQKFMDSEFNMEDFSSRAYAKFQNRVAKQEEVGVKSVAVVESLAKDKTHSSYSKILTWVDVGNSQVLKSEYYDHSGRLLKTMEFKDYKLFGGKTWRAQTIEVKNVQNQRGTILKVANLKLNLGLDDDEFTQSALEDN